MHKKWNEGKQKPSINYLIKLIPNSICHLGNEKFYKKYMEMIKLKSLNLYEKAEMGELLMKVGKCRVWSVQNEGEEMEKL